MKIEKPVIKPARKVSAEKTQPTRKESVEKAQAQRKVSAEKVLAPRKVSAEKTAQVKTQPAQQTNFVNDQQTNGNRRFEPEYEVIVCSLSYESTEPDIKAHFAKCPSLKFVKLMMGQDGRSRGKAFVKFSTEEGMKEALTLNETYLGGRKILVELTEKMMGGQQQNNQGGQRPQGNVANQSGNDQESI